MLFMTIGQSPGYVIGIKAKIEEKIMSGIFAYASK